jgi:monovalent cation:proton antiporter-2 (CPA2) family protein
VSLFQIFVYLLAAVVAVPLAKRLGLGSVLGYLLAGVAIGPALLGVVGASEDVAHVAEFGVVMMLFLIGLELRPSLLWRLRVPIAGLGGSQVTGVTAAVAGIALATGLAWKPALAIGLILAMSSTAIVLQSLSERGQLKLSAGQSCFSVLLFQDIAVIPILAVLPLLGDGTAVNDTHGVIGHLPPWQRGLATLGAVMALVVAGRFVLRPVFRYVAATRLREVFTEMTLLLVVGVTLLMGAVGISAALGAFVAGVMLADSEYRHQLEADIEPFKGLLLGLFFITVGAGIDFTLIAARPGFVAALVAGLVMVKFVIHLPLARLFHLDWPQATLFALALAQGGEFCFVLLAFAQGTGVLPADIVKPLIAAVALSMALTPLLFVLNDRVFQRALRAYAPRKPERDADEIPANENPVILAGFGRFGHIVGRLLIANRIGCTVLENDPEQIELLARFGLKAYYGDASRADLLHAAGAEQAKLFICTLADEQKTLEIVRMVQREFPHLRILVRAVNRQHAYELLRAGVNDVFRETLGSALDLGVAALRGLGMRGVQALRAARLLREHDEASVRDLATFEGDEKSYATRARQHMTNLEAVLNRDTVQSEPSGDGAWNSEPRSGAKS